MHVCVCVSVHVCVWCAFACVWGGVSVGVGVGVQHTFLCGFGILCAFVYAIDLVYSSFKKAVTHQTQEQ